MTSNSSNAQDGKYTIDVAYNGKSWKLSPVLSKDPLDYRKLFAFNLLGILCPGFPLFPLILPRQWPSTNPFQSRLPGTCCESSV